MVRTHFPRDLKFAAALTVGCLAACTTPKPQVLEPAPRIDAFKASVNALPEQGYVELSWATTHATAIELRDSTGRALALEEVKAAPIEGATAPVETASDAGLDADGGTSLGVDVPDAGELALPLSGSGRVKVTATALFTLVARNARGASATAVATVRIGVDPGELMLSAVPPRVMAGDTTVLGWFAPGAREVVLAPVGGAPIDLGGQRESGSVTVTVATTTVYRLTVGERVQNIKVEAQPKILAFGATPQAAVPGEPLQLSWRTAGAAKLTLKTASGEIIAAVEDAEQVASGSIAVNVPLEVDPDTVFSYVLTAEPTQGPVSRKELSVYVSGAPHIVALETPEYALVDSEFSIVWRTVQADAVRIYQSDVLIYESSSAQSAAAGRVMMKALATDVDYKIVAVNGRGGEAFETRKVRPTTKTALVSFAASSQTIATAGDSVTLTWNATGARRVRISNGGFTLLTGKGPEVETGSLVVYPNGAASEYRFEADNTLGDEVEGTVQVAVTQPASFAAVIPGPVFPGTRVAVNHPVNAGAGLIFGMPHLDTTVEQGGFIDIRTTGEALEFGPVDDATKRFTADFETWLYGSLLPGKVSVSTNGFLAFSSNATASLATHEAIPSASAIPFMVAPFWTDLKLTTDSSVHWQVLGEPPNRELVVQWTDLQLVDDDTSSLTFQARVHQTGVTRFAYQTMTAAAMPSPLPSMGVQGPMANLGISGQDLGFTAGDSVVFFGPKQGPLEVTLSEPLTYSGFLKLGDGYLPLKYLPTEFVARGELTLSEVMPAPAPAVAATGEWFEIRNVSKTAIDLNGWQLELDGVPFHTLSSALGTTVIPANGMLVVGQSALPAENDGVPVQYAYGAALALPDATGELTLRNGDYLAQLSWSSAVGSPGVAITVDTGQFLIQGDTAGTAPHPMRCNATAAYGTQSPQQLGTPGTPGACFPYAISRRPLSYRDISLSGTPLFDSLSTDESMAQVDIASAPFTHFGTPTSLVSVATNGFIGFRPLVCTGGVVGICYLSGKSAPNGKTEPYGVLSVYWADLEGGDWPGANVYQARVAAGEDAANPVGHWIFQWHRFAVFANPTDDFNFQVKLFDDGAIEIHYAGMQSAAATRANGTNAVIWLEHPAGLSANVIGVRKPVISPNSAYRFTPN